MANSNVPKIQFTAAGVTAPTEQSVLAGVQADIDAAFGGGLNPSLETPQGQLASSWAALIGDRNAEFLALVNGIDPAYASGRMQDAIVRLNFLTRKAATATTVTAQCVGLSGTVIPEGSLARAVDGNVYRSTSAATIGISGTVDVPFVCTFTGPIACPAGSLTTVYRIVPGWDTVNNADDGTPGRDVEGRIDLEARRQASVSKNARGFNSAMRGALLDLTDVVDAYVIDNPTADPVTIQGVTLDPYEVYIAVFGGTDSAVASVIAAKKAPGAPYYASANTTVTVEDTQSGYLPPYPTYTVKFERPAQTAAHFRVRIRNSPAVPADVEDQVRAAIVSTFNGDDGVPKRAIGATLFASQFYGAVAGLGAWARVIEIEVGHSAGTVTTTQAFDIDQIPSLNPVHIVVDLIT